MGQSSSRHAAPARASYRPIRSINCGHTGQYAYSDDGTKSTDDVPQPRRWAASHQAEAQSITSSSKHPRTTSSNTASVRSHKEQPARNLAKSASQRKFITPNRLYYYDELESAHRHDDKAPWSSNQRTKSQLSLPGSNRRRPRQKKECVICTESRSLSRFPSHAPTARCAHNADVCRRCLRIWISTTFASKTWDEINCPICSERLDYEDVCEFAPSEVFRKYKKLNTKAALESIPGFHWCLTRGCKSGQVIEPGTNKMCCVECKKTHCIEHNMVWHKGETCKEYDYRTNEKIKKEEEKASKKWLKEKAKTCPGCKRPIEKINGCDHMTCSKCRHEFCWECLAPYKKPRNATSVTHRPECPHHVSRSPRTVDAGWDEGWVYGR